MSFIQKAVSVSCICIGKQCYWNQTQKCPLGLRFLKLVGSAKLRGMYSFTNLVQGVLAFHDFTIHDPRKFMIFSGINFMNSSQIHDFDTKDSKKNDIRKIFKKISEIFPEFFFQFFV